MNCQNCNNDLTQKKYILKFDASIFECKNCGMAFMQPFADSKTYNDAYYYFSDYTKKAIYEDVCKARRIGGYIKKYFPESISVFDMGAAAGILLNQLKKTGYSVAGIEISEQGIKLASEKFNIKLIKADINSFNEKIDADVVMMTDTLEHTLNPSVVLKNLNIVMKSGAGLIIEVPNYGSFYRKIIGDRWVGFNKFHNFHFTTDSLKKIAVKNNFEIIDCFTSNFNILSAEGIWRLGIKDKIKEIIYSFKNTRSIINQKKNIDISIFSDLKIKNNFFKFLNPNTYINFVADKKLMGDQLWLILKKK